MDYPQWKILVWRFVRTGFAAGLSVLATVTVVLQPDLSNIKEWTLALVSAFLAGFISAVAKGLRDHFSDGDQESKVNKLPL